MICLTVIARNEARCLQRCLRSAAPFVDEMLVVDTGSEDDTRAIALACGARLADFEWVDDFSAARNYALSLTDAEWRLVLDADEWIEGGGSCLREAVASPQDGGLGQATFVGEVSIRSAFDDGATVRIAPSWIARFLPLGVVFEGRIHEQAVHGLPVRRLPLQVGHDGYRRAQQHGKSGRNERLLRIQLAATPANAFLRYQLGKDLQVHERYAEACDEYRRARELIAWPPVDRPRALALRARCGWLHDLVARELYCLKRAGNFEVAMQYANEQAPWWQHSPDFHFALGDLLLDVALAQPERSAQLLPLMEASWMRCLELGESPHLEGSVQGRGSFLAAHNLAVLHDLCGNPVKAAHFRTLSQQAKI